MATATSTLPHTIITIGPPRPLSTSTTSQCTNTIDEEGYAYGCVSTPACVPPLVLSTDTSESPIYGDSTVPVFLCVNPLTSSINPGGPIQTVTTTSINPGGSSSSSASSGSSPSGTASASLRHPSLTGSYTTVPTTSSTGTGTSSSVSPTASGNVAVGVNGNLGQPSLVGIVVLCWMGVWGWRTLRGRL